MIRNNKLLLVAVFRTVVVVTLGLLFYVTAKPTIPKLFYYLCLSAGCIASVSLSGSKLTSKGLTTFALLGFIALYILTGWLSYFDVLFNVESFFWLRISEHIFFGTVISLLSFITSLLFIRSKVYVAFELIFILITITALVAAHREFQLDNPKIISDLVWSRGITQVTGFVILGSIYAIFSLGYLALSYSLNTSKNSTVSANRSFKSSALTYGTVGTLCIVLIVSIFSTIQQFYTHEAEQLTGNGVTQANSKDDNPLKFFDSLGGSSDPTAIVRFNSDYNKNPLEPLLYFRQNALSKMNDSRNGTHESSMRFGPEEFDNDTPLLSSKSVFVLGKSLNKEERIKIDYEVYLITDHQYAFFLDYPLKASPIKNPKPDRFIGAYKALSYVPTYKLDELNSKSIGSPDWDSEKWNYYTEKHFDPRYAEYARKIAPSGVSPVDQAFALRDHIVETATYTLTPQNELPDTGDQVAAFLFGKKRGYCVHFAHSMVYMLRSLGIPARIGAGYLIDSKLIKDGHALLRMSDRHAWAEVYIDPYGWVPFDVHPKNVESHAQSEINSDLFDELIAMLGPSEDELPELTKEDLAETGQEDFSTFSDYLPEAGLVITVALGLILLYLIAKAYLWFGWKLTNNLDSKQFLIHRSTIAKLSDLGFSRNSGETMQEFRTRMKQVWKKDILPTTDLFILKFFTKQKIEKDLFRSEPVALLDNTTFISKVLAFINPSSLKIFFYGNKLNAK